MPKPSRAHAYAIAVAVGALLAAVVTNAIRQRSNRATENCANLLRIFGGMKAQWALENKMGDHALPSWDDIRPYCKGDVPPHGAYSPSGGVYTLGRVKDNPSCSIPAHTKAAFP